MLAPTRELAVQIEDDIHGLAYHTGVTSAAIYLRDQDGDGFDLAGSFGETAGGFAPVVIPAEVEVAPAASVAACAKTRCGTTKGTQTSRTILQRYRATLFRGDLRPMVARLLASRRQVHPNNTAYSSDLLGI